MQPIIEYKALGTHSSLSLNRSIVQKREGKTYRNFKNKKEFTDYIDTIKPSVRVNGCVSVTCSCGKLYEYNTKEDLPSTSFICDCSRQIITYS